MAGLLRRCISRPLMTLPSRGGGAKAWVSSRDKWFNGKRWVDSAATPVDFDKFPLTSEKTMGPHGWMRGSYSITKGIVGPLYRPPWVVGGIYNPTIDPEQHFNTQDRFKTVPLSKMIKYFAYNLLAARVQIVMVFVPILCILFVTWIEQRREPMEIFMDREKYFEHFDDYNYGVYFDHHHYSHQLCHRRAHKWGYAGQDIMLEDEVHH